MSESPKRRLEAPDHLGAPAPSSLSPRASRFMDRQGRSMGRESARMILLSIVGGAAVIFGLLVLGQIVRGKASLLHVEQHVDHVAVAYFVGLAFGTHDAALLGFSV